MGCGVFDRETWAQAKEVKTRGADRKRVLILGWSPLPFENERMNYAPGVRTWQFASALATEGHAVCVACARIPGAYHTQPPPIVTSEPEGVLVFSMDREVFDSPDAINDLVEVFAPDLLVGASAVPSLRAVKIAGQRPVWVDLFGDPMAEAQAKDLADAQGPVLPAYRDLLAAVLERGDAFSAVAERQRYAAIGQLGLAGRLNRFTAGYEFVHTVPCCILGDLEGRRVESALATTSDLGDLGDDDFVVLWSGGFNTWCDVKTLFCGLELAMAANPNMRFVSTGGAIAGHDDGTYDQWLEMVSKSRYKDRFAIKGCLPESEAAAYQLRANLGVVTERPIYERSLGSSARLLRWLESGLPLVCTVASEIGEQIRNQGVGLTYQPSDGEDLGRVIIAAAEDRPRLLDMAARAREFALATWNISRTTEPLRKWVGSARRAPDSNQTNPIAISELIAATAELTECRSQLDLLGQRADWLGDCLAEAKANLDEIHGSRMWSLWMRYIAIRNALLRPLQWLRPGSAGSF